MASALVVAVSWFLLAISQTTALFDVTSSCLQCLCEAVSGGPFCNFPGSCHDGVCGPYSITLPYWQDGGRPTKGLEDRQTTEAYENCALDKACAEATIRGYMRNFHQDCNGDGLEDCYDYAAIHFHGGYGCNKPLSVPAKNTLDACLHRLTPAVQPRPEPPVEPTPPPPVDPKPQVPVDTTPQHPVDSSPQPPVNSSPQAPVYPKPDRPGEERPDHTEVPFPEPEDPVDNEIVFPKQGTTYPSIDIRLKGHAL